PVMRTLELALEPGDAPLYRRMAATLRGALRDGRLQPGELIPSTRWLAEAWGVHRHTVMTALDELVAEGWLTAEKGRGYRVDPAVLVEEAPAPRVSYDRAWDVARKVELHPPPEVECPYRFPSGHPDLRLFPTDEYFAAMRTVCRRVDPQKLLGYEDAGGVEPLLEQLRIWLRRVRGVTGRDIVVTHGSQEAIYLLAQLLVRPGDTVAVEALGYRPAWEALRAAGAALKPIPLDDEGLQPDALEKLLRSQSVRLIYTTPLHQYPTTVTLSVARRLELHRIASRYGALILEDDYDHEFHYRCHPIAPLAAADPAGIVLYVSTFSKVLYPSARLGYAVVPAELAGSLRRLKQVVSRQNDTLVQLTVAQWMADGGFERHLRRMARRYASRMDAMVAALDGVELRMPQGGMSLWANLGVDSEALAEAARRKGVGVTPGTRYSLRARPTPWLRLGFASSSEAEIQEGIARLLQARISARRRS
ncbi:MAG: MocR-like pyridoxine biosynthesis transcription factor PdxR, partial [Candidatus Xenobia bacterium]